jgi:hypothetical protein
MRYVLIASFALFASVGRAEDVSWTFGKPTPRLSINAAPSAPEVARPKGVTFRNGDNFDPDHQCDRCGRTQTVISGWLPNGQHTHTCRACNYTWRH